MPTVDETQPELRLIADILSRAEGVLPREIRDYLFGAAGRETTLARNRAALDRVLFRPRVLRDVSRLDTGVRVLGQELRIPVFLSPVGSLGCFHPQGVRASARAASAFGTLLFCGINAEAPLEDVANESARPLGLQLYVYGERDWAASVLDRAEAAGYSLVCITVDGPVPARRERDIANDHQILRSLPRPNLPARVLDANGAGQARVTWDDIAFLKARSGLPIVLKGIQTAEDAILAQGLGLAGIYVSNHGGRQLDHVRASIEVLPEIRAAVGPGFPVVIDSGFRHGADVVKALAVGADAVGIGRLHAAALAAGGEMGVAAALSILELEVRDALAHLGVRSVRELEPSHVLST